MSASGTLLTESADVDAVLALIAKQVFGLTTLATRNSDDLDFHDLAVWKIRDALRRAYHAGRTSAGLPTTKGENA